MTLDELRKLRDAMNAAEDKLLNNPDETEAHKAYELAANVYEIAAVEYVDSVLDAMSN